jgi:hypothetical protein
MREAGVMGYLILNIDICSFLQEEGGHLISAFKACPVDRSPAILERKEMRGRDGNDRDLILNIGICSVKEEGYHLISA